MVLLTKLFDADKLKYLVVGFAGAAALGYSVYFDYLRTSSPDYKSKIRRKRKIEAEKLRREIDQFNEFPHPTDKVALQQFMMNHLSRGDDLMNIGKVEQGAMHLANAVIVSERPNELMSILQQTMPPPTFLAVTRALPVAKQRYEEATVKHLAVDKDNSGPRFLLLDDDLE